MLNTIISQFNIFFLCNIVFFIFLLLICLPKTNKQKKKILPHKIVIIDDTIVCYAETYTESKLIADVKFVRDFGDFYELVFPFGQISEKFLCQKNLIKKVTIDDFKRLFAEQIIPTNQKKTGDGSMSF